MTEEWSEGRRYRRTVGWTERNRQTDGGRGTAGLKGEREGRRAIGMVRRTEGWRDRRTDERRDGQMEGNRGMIGGT